MYAKQRQPTVLTVHAILGEIASRLKRCSTYHQSNPGLIIMSSASCTITTRREWGGERPSSAAATFDNPSASFLLADRYTFNAAAAEDGRTPVAVARCAL